ncbi:MAG: hypothetical protein WC683_01495 [bacterium]
MRHLVDQLNEAVTGRPGALAEGRDNFRTLAKAVRDLRAEIEGQVRDLIDRIVEADLPEKELDALQEHLMFACKALPVFAEKVWSKEFDHGAPFE